MAELTVPPAADGQRLDRYLKKALPSVPYIAIQKMLRTGKIRLDGKRAKADARLTAGQVLDVPTDNAPKAEGQGAYQLSNADKALLKSITLFEDESILVLNKPAGLAAQAGSGISKSLDRMLAALYGADNAPKLTHRLDRETTGLIVFAKTRAAAQHVTAQFANHEVEKHYLALLEGQGMEKAGHIRAPLAKQSHAHGSRSVVSDDGDPAHTSYTTLGMPDGHTLVDATPHTGRMNQLRVHFAHLGHPIVGDDKYGAATRGPLHLHAWKLTLTHPVTGKRQAFAAPLPEWARALGII
jgi:23S rRNA pseudouridine955/2504/2580 synthase